jgi:hypothetical protein
MVPHLPHLEQTIELPAPQLPLNGVQSWNPKRHFQLFFSLDFKLIALIFSIFYHRDFWYSKEY